MRLKNLFLAIAMTVTAAVAMAQTNGFSYQAVVRDSKGEIVKNQKVGLKLTLADNTGSKVMYEETQTATTSSYGVLTVTVGEGKPQNNSRLSNGPIESLNRKVKDLKRMGRGYRNFEHFRNRFLYATRNNPVLNGISDYNPVLYQEED